MFKEFISEIGLGNFNEDFERVEGESFLIVKEDRIIIIPTKSSIVIVIRGDSDECNKYSAHLYTKNRNEYKLIGSEHFPIEEDMENYMVNSNKCFKELLLDIARVAGPIIEAFTTARFCLIQPKRATH